MQATQEHHLVHGDHRYVFKVKADDVVTVSLWYRRGCRRWVGSTRTLDRTQARLEYAALVKRGYSKW